MRLFLAYDFESTIVSEIEKISSFLKKEFEDNPNFTKNFKANFVDTSSIHITLKFFEDEDENLIVNSLRNSNEDFSLHNYDFYLLGLNAFPDKNQPKVLVLPVYDEANLIEKNFLKIEKILNSVGIKKETRKFKPHLTIARIKYCNFNSFDNFNYWGKLIIYESDKLKFKLNKLKLYQSILTPEKPIYKEMYEF